MLRFQPNPNYFGGTEYMIKGFHEKIAPHLVNIHSYNQMVAPGIWYPPLDALSAPLIIWLHNTHNQLNYELVQFMSHSVMHKNIYRYIVPSEFAKQNWVSIGFPEDKIHVLPNAIDEKLWFKEKDKNEIPTLIYTSNEQRGLETLLRSTDLFDFDFRLEVFSHLRPGENVFFNQNTPSDWVTKLKNYDKMTFYGFSPRKTILKHLANADLFIYPSTYLETFCLAAVESIAIGLPTIISNVGALPETCEDNAFQVEYEKTFVEYINQDTMAWSQNHKAKFPKYHAHNLEQIASTVKNVLENYPTIEERQAKRQAMMDKYSWEAVKQKWIEFDQSLEPIESNPAKQ